VEFNRDNTPLRAYIVGRKKEGGQRFLANHGNVETLRFLAAGSKEPIGLSGSVAQDSNNRERNLFSLSGDPKL
jgi:hypothetical protein